MEEIEGFIKLPIKSMTRKAVEEIEKVYEKYQAELDYFEGLGVEGKVEAPNIDENDYIEMITTYVDPKAIVSFKKADDGNVDISTESVLDYTRIYMNFEDFVELLKLNK